MKRTVKLCAAAACAAIAIGMAGCDLGTSGFGTVRGPDAPPDTMATDPDLMLPPEYFDDADANWSDPWLWMVNDAGTATIVGYRGPPGHVVIPERLRLGDDCGDEYCEDEDCEEGYYTVTAITRPRQAGRWVDMTDWGIEEPEWHDPMTFVRPPVFPNRALTSVEIPETIIVIGPGAFAETNMTSVRIPDSVTEIGVSAFRDSNLASVHIPNSVTEIGENAFLNTHLTHVTIPGSVHTLRSGSFANSRLTSVEIQYGVVHIINTFWQNQITGHLAIPASVRTITGSAFIRNRITSVYIPYGVTTLRGFYNNQITGHLELPDSLTSIGDLAFRNNRITSFTWPRNLNTISNHTFSINSFTSVTVPDHVTVVGAFAFLANPSLREVTIPASVTYIGSSAFGHPAGFGINAIDYANRNAALQRVTFEGSVPRANIFGDPLRQHGANSDRLNEARQCAFPGNLHAAMGTVASGTFVRTGEGLWRRP